MSPDRREFLAGAAGLVVLASGCRIQTSADSPPAAPPGFVRVPGATYRMGVTRETADELAGRWDFHPSWFDAEIHDEDVSVASFLIQERPVTAGEYHRFATETGAEVPWGGQPPSNPDAPITFVGQDQAEAYAAWLGGRLPTEAEWELAARGTDGRLYPWGSEWEPSKVVCATNGPANVDEDRGDASPCGARQMVGNVAEWCAGVTRNCSPVRGGSWMHTHPFYLRTTSRFISGWRSNRLSYIGFRCAMDIATGEVRP